MCIWARRGDLMRTLPCRLLVLECELSCELSFLRKHSVLPQHPACSPVSYRHRQNSVLPKFILILSSQVVSICTSQKMKPFKVSILPKQERPSTRAVDRSCLLWFGSYSSFFGCNFKNSYPISSAKAESGKGKKRVLLILLLSIWIEAVTGDSEITEALILPLLSPHSAWSQRGAPLPCLSCSRMRPRPRK